MLRVHRRVPVYAVVVLLLVCCFRAWPQAAVQSGVSHELAKARATRVSDLHYRLSFSLVPHAAQTAASETLSFKDSGSGDLPIDYRDGSLERATLNGKSISIATTNGHLVLPAGALVHGVNTLHVSFQSNIASSGKAITRYEDKDDGSEYLYTLFVPMDASMAFPCFDQPDLKAGFTLTLDHPDAWTVIGNAAASVTTNSGGFARTVFPETRPISTYLFAFAAGPWQRIAGAAPAQPAIFVRKSQLVRAQQEAPEVQTMAASGIRYLTSYFQQPFPFSKYDLVLIPGFPFGGMEHAGATFLNEDGVLFRSTPTASDYFRRDILVLHETTHQWFGDLVTMRWFDDLWLKEGFAQYMAYKAMAQLKPATEPWKHFAEDIKPLAYGIDETEGTTPIFQNIPNLKDAKSAYGAIVYQKAPAVLKQLDFKLGNDPFRDGLRLYLAQHAYANATWPDLIHAFTQAGGQGVQAWADAWIVRRGMPQIDVDWSCNFNRIGKMTLSQKDVLPDGYTWPISDEVLLGYAGSQQRVRVDWSGSTQEVAEAIGKPCPEFVFANAGDEAYGRFLLDFGSQRFLASPNAAHPEIASVAEPLLRSQLYAALWENVRAAHTAPRGYVELALKTLPTEMDESLNRIQGGRIAESLHLYLGPQSRSTILPQAENVIGERMLHAPTLGVRIVNFRTFTVVAESAASLTQLKRLLKGSLTIDGLKLKPLDRWNMVGHLLAMNDPDAGKYLAAEQARDHSGEAQKYAYAVQAGTPDAATKARYFAEYLQTTGPDARQEDWISQSLRPFNSWNQQALTLPYLHRALNELPAIKRDRKIFFLGAWLGAFLDGQSTPSAQQIVDAWLARKDIDHDLRLKVLENKDALDRTVRIRASFPQ
jgi:aminopeptidase N